MVTRLVKEPMLEHGLLGVRPLMLEVSGSEEMRRWFVGGLAWDWEAMQSSCTCST